MFLSDEVDLNDEVHELGHFINLNNLSGLPSFQTMDQEEFSNFVKAQNHIFRKHNHLIIVRLKKPLKIAWSGLFIVKRFFLQH